MRVADMYMNMALWRRDNVRGSDQPSQPTLINRRPRRWYDIMTRLVLMLDGIRQPQRNDNHCW